MDFYFRRLFRGQLQEAGLVKGKNTILCKIKESYKI
jgi:hypothetical protein